MISARDVTEEIDDRNKGSDVRQPHRGHGNTRQKYKLKFLPVSQQAF